MSGRKMIAVLMGIVVSVTGVGCGKGGSSVPTIYNVSYDPTREFYEEYNRLFNKYYEEKYGTLVRIIQSHGGSGSQARSVVEGCSADVVTLALEHDITLIEKTGLIDSGWEDEFEYDSAPYTSTIVFLVRTGNPKNIRDWDDLTRDGVDVITPDPKSSGGACWNFLAALSYARTRYADVDEQNAFVGKIYDNVSVMDTGARGSTTTFVENSKGDVLISWENEAITTCETYPGQYEIVSPSVSILAQPSVAIVDDNARTGGTEELAAEYLSYLYSDDAQRLAAKNGYRPVNEDILQEYSDVFDLSMRLTTIEDFGGWEQAYTDYFDDGALFDKIYNY
jgi:sulfate transport system substrate-binding protein